MAVNIEAEDTPEGFTLPVKAVKAGGVSGAEGVGVRCGDPKLTGKTQRRSGVI